MSPTKPCPCGTVREHLGNGVYRCYKCGHIWDTWKWCAPPIPNPEKDELIRSWLTQEDEDEDE